MTTKPNHSPSDLGRVNLIIKALVDCGQEVTKDAVQAQFRRETGRDLPPMWERSPAARLQRRVADASSRVAEDEGETHASVDRKD